MRKLVINKEMSKVDIAIVTAKEYQEMEGIQNLVLDLDIKSMGGMPIFKKLLEKVSMKTEHMYFFIESFRASKFRSN